MVSSSECSSGLTDSREVNEKGACLKISFTTVLKTWALAPLQITASLCEGTICENPELASRPSCVYLSTPGSLLTTQRNDIIAQYVKVLQVVYLSQDIPSELSHDIYNQKTAESTMRSDSISATGSRCSQRPHLHRSLLFNKSIAMSTLRTQHASHGEGPNSYMWLQRMVVWLICIKANFVWKYIAVG